MNTIQVRNVHRALPPAVQLLAAAGLPRPSRYGDVLVASQPVTTCYEEPLERVLFWAERDANPYLHFADAMWLLGGRRDVEYLARFSTKMRTFSDDGEVYHGAYGNRLRDRFTRRTTVGQGPRDQLVLIAEALADNPNDRRQVAQIWDSDSDLGTQSKDIPCNLTVKFQVNTDGELDMVVFNRSNDIVWGCYGANAVQFSYLQEYVALRSGHPVGRYWQISCDWHGYRSTFEPLLEAFKASDGDPLEDPCPYERGLVKSYPLMQVGSDTDQWDIDLRRFLTRDGRAPAEGRWHDPFWADVALPLIRSHDLYKDCKGEERFEGAIRMAEHIEASDWRTACQEWLTRRYARWRSERDDGPRPEGALSDG